MISAGTGAGSASRGSPVGRRCSAPTGADGCQPAHTARIRGVPPRSTDTAASKTASPTAKPAEPPRDPDVRHDQHQRATATYPLSGGVAQWRRLPRRPPASRRGASRPTGGGGPGGPGGRSAGASISPPAEDRSQHLASQAKAHRHARPWSRHRLIGSRPVSEEHATSPATTGASPVACRSPADPLSDPGGRARTVEVSTRSSSHSSVLGHGGGGAGGRRGRGPPPGLGYPGDALMRSASATVAGSRPGAGPLPARSGAVGQPAAAGRRHPPG